MSNSGPNAAFLALRNGDESMLDKTLAVLGGAGKIGSAIINGMLEKGAAKPEQFTITALHQYELERDTAPPVRGTTDNKKAIRGADVLILCVHPADIPVLLKEIAPFLEEQQLVISVATGVTTAAIEAQLGAGQSVIRAMPNTAVQVAQSMTTLCRGRHVRDDELAVAKNIFEAVGEVEILDERHLNAATGLGGCGPAFVFKIIEALSEGGVKVGLPREAARKMAAQTLRGAAEMVLRTGKHPAALKDEVTTPGGCTIDGIAKLEQHGISIALIDAVETSTLKAGKLG